MNIPLQWDAKLKGDSRTSVRIYERVGNNAPYTYNGPIADIPDPATTTMIQNPTVGTHTYVARAVTQGTNGLPTQESADSNPVTTTILSAPAVPTNFSIAAVVTK